MIVDKNKWEDVVCSLNRFQKHMQGTLSQYIDKVIQGGISTDQGLSGINKDGSLFIDYRINSMESIKEGFVHDLRLRALALIFKYQVWQSDLFQKKWQCKDDLTIDKVDFNSFYRGLSL